MRIKFIKKIIIISILYFLLILKNNGNEYLKREININLNENNEKNIFEKLMLASTLIKIYSDIYDYSREGYIKPIFSNKIRDYSSNKKKINTSLYFFFKGIID